MYRVVPKFSKGAALQLKYAHICCYGGIDSKICIIIFWGLLFKKNK